LSRKKYVKKKNYGADPGIEVIGVQVLRHGVRGPSQSHKWIAGKPRWKRFDIYMDFYLFSIILMW
jgi:hypothetical protein